jgi:hypothetical protein
MTLSKDIFQDPPEVDDKTPSSNSLHQTLPNNTDNQFKQENTIHLNPQISLQSNEENI